MRTNEYRTKNDYMKYLMDGLQMYKLYLQCYKKFKIHSGESKIDLVNFFC